jgi:TRAP-type mannitol/chloroaromatic compound transport system substrate-binding protein
MRYLLAIVAFFSLVFVACKENTQVTCSVDSVTARSGDTYFGIAQTYCDNIMEAEWEMMQINPYPAGNIPLGAVIILP